MVPLDSCEFSAFNERFPMHLWWGSVVHHGFTHTVLRETACFAGISCSLCAVYSCIRHMRECVRVPALMCRILQDSCQKLGVKSSFLHLPLLLHAGFARQKNPQNARILRGGFSGDMLSVHPCLAVLQHRFLDLNP
jgi:hypothetical protein